MGDTGSKDGDAMTNDPDVDGSLVVGRHAVAQALATNPQQAQELLLAGGGGSSRAMAKVIQTAKAAGAKVRRVDRTVLDQLAGQANHQGVALKLASGGYADLEDIVEAAQAAGNRALVVLCDHLQDPHNLGAVIRSAAAAGAQGVVAPKDRACGLTPATAKAAAGGLEVIPVARVTNLSSALARLQEAGLWGLAAATTGALPPWELDLDMPLVLVVGGEHKGIGQRLLSACEMSASIPLNPAMESLNASVAAGILLFEILRQRTVA